MRLLKFSFLLFFIFAVSSCTVSKQIKQLEANANSAFQLADYKLALESYQEIINLNESNNKKVNGIVYQKAGIAAWEVGETSKAIDYLEKAKEKSAANAKSYFILGKAYHKVDNLSREIINLEHFVEAFPNDEQLGEVSGQLFFAYVESTNWEKASDLWKLLTADQKTEVDFLSGQLKYKKALGDNNLVSLAQSLLKIDPKSVDALEVLGIHYYESSEERYQKEMRAYEKNRTNRQYRILLTALDDINANFKLSRDYLERLYTIDPNPRYANLLGNIYTRFDNKQKADFYYRKAKVN